MHHSPRLVNVLCALCAACAVAGLAGSASAAGTITITAPANGASVTGTVTVTVSASDFGNLTKVAFYVDGTWKATDTAAPWAWSWDTTKTATGPHGLRVRGYDAVTAAWVDSARNTVTVYRPDTTPPTGAITINGGASAINTTAVTLTLSAVDPENAITAVKLSNDGVTYTPQTTYAATKAWTLAAGEGVKTVYAQFKNAANLWSAPVTDTITLDTTPPQVQITDPKDQQIIPGP